MTNDANKLIVNTPVFHNGFEFPAHILLTPMQIDRVSDQTLIGIDGYAGEETKAGALETWIGRFATDELYEHGLGIRGWTANLNMVVEGADCISNDRALPFVVTAASGAFMLSNDETNPDVIEVERSFTPRVMGYLLEKGIIV